MGKSKDDWLRIGYRVALAVALVVVFSQMYRFEIWDKGLLISVLTVAAVMFPVRFGLAAIFGQPMGWSARRDQK